MGRLLLMLANPWVAAAGGGAAAIWLWRKNRNKNEQLRDAKLELFELQRSLDRTRAELAREKHAGRSDGPY